MGSLQLGDLFLPARRLLGCAFMALAFPCFVMGLLASPLCGAGTYFSLPPPVCVKVVVA